MKRKVFSVFFILMLVSSITNLSAVNSTFNTDPEAGCLEMAQGLFEASYFVHGNTTRALSLAIWAYNDCMDDALSGPGDLGDLN